MSKFLIRTGNGTYKHYECPLRNHGRCNLQIDLSLSHHPMKKCSNLKDSCPLLNGEVKIKQTTWR